ncbi:MAG: ROK family glucokinase [Lachnospiraceae bacterium]|nr:ROK family glucokinase [Lachnospiraceae bacterium]
MKCAYGVDVGGTAIKIGLIEEDGRIIKKWEIPTRTDESGSKVLPDIAAFIRGIRTENAEGIDIIGIGLGVPGPVDGNGMVLTSANLHWEEPIDAAGILSEMLDDTEVRVANDANAAALGEAWMGAGDGSSDTVMVTLGTGVVGGVIHQGRIYSGVYGAAGEIGNLCVNPAEKVRCNCGRHGCLEQYASATGIVRLATEVLSGTTENSVLRQRPISAKSVWDAVKEGDEPAIEVAERFGHYLGWGLALVAGVINPDVYVIGGGMSSAGEVILPYIEKNYRAMALPAASNARVCLAALGNDAGILGAARLMLQDEA